MTTTLDGKALFDEQDLRIEVGALKRASIERAVPGLDGVASIDLGLRGRQLRQRGVLRAPSVAALRRRVDAITKVIDGDTHTLVTSDGVQYDRLLVDSFELLDQQTVGAGITARYEIVYRQLGS